MSKIKEIDVLKRRDIDLLYIWLNNYQRDIRLKEGEIVFLKYRRDLIEKAIKEKEELK